MVADALEVTRDEDEFKRRLDRGRILQHVGEQLATDLRLQSVQLVVLVQASLRKLSISADERIERVAEDRLGDPGHARNVDQLLHRWTLAVPSRGLGNVHGKIAHT